MTSDVIEIGKIAAILRVATNSVIASEAKQSRLSSIAPGLLRGACHRAALCADPLARNDGQSAKRCIFQY